MSWDLESLVNYGNCEIRLEKCSIIINGNSHTGSWLGFFQCRIFHLKHGKYVTYCTWVRCGISDTSIILCGFRMKLCWQTKLYVMGLIHVLIHGESAEQNIKSAAEIHMDYCIGYTADFPYGKFRHVNVP